MFSWTKNINKARYAIDALLLLLMLCVAAQKATGNLIHEWLGLALLVPFIVHLVQHWEWITNIPKRFFGRLNLQSRLNVVLNMALYLAMLWVLISGLLTSKEALPMLGFEVGRDAFWKAMHHDAANFLLVMIGVHMALHWSWVVKMTKKVFARKPITKAQAVSGGAQ
ncbi:DUF4405 domain-containing protein [Reinekea marinisedimentorum]|uniref:Uncharacterized protein DUF4405 n=1 Tax=Reinekea marinisedimentorum TaxID=230495 RepID=A0A4R3ID88_9GAMM|nr:DUF4405 domain-containing protein [Reinekea marinisedimentorum]TCS43726.1 uncharacterized protein DUF4405 [Reinekea marinisedimentorum]